MSSGSREFYPSPSWFSRWSLNRIKAGFTLVELMVVITIASVVITSIVIQQEKWNDNLAVSTQAYEMALMIRQAQYFSLGVREYTGSSGDRFNVGYGVYFDSNSTGRYIFFADKNRDSQYSPDEIIEAKVLNKGVIISRICGFKDNNQERCSPDAGNVSTIHISFFRPEPKANILILNNAGHQSGSVLPPAIIYLRSIGGKEFSVKVESNGQISVNQ